MLNSFIQRALADATITLCGDGNQLRVYIYISDLVDALVLRGYSPQGGPLRFHLRVLYSPALDLQRRGIGDAHHSDRR